MRLLIHDLTDKELEKLLPKLDDNITYLIKALIIFFHTL